LQLDTLRVDFDLDMHPGKLQQWRGAVAAGWEHDRFHNHAPDGSYQFRYPLIQYRCRGGKASLWAIGEGVASLRHWLATGSGRIQWGQQGMRQLYITAMEEQQQTLGLSPDSHRYRITDYLALNQENYRRWQQLDDMLPRIELLNELLNGHLLACCRTLGLEVSEQLDSRCMLLQSVRPVRYRDHRRMAFNLLFKSPLILPAGLGLGRAASHGFGMTLPLRGNELLDSARSK
jgi:hypothetical protein